MQAVGVRVDFPEISVINQDVVDFFPGFAPPRADNRARHRVLVLLCELILLADMAACHQGVDRPLKKPGDPVPLMPPLVRHITNSFVYQVGSPCRWVTACLE
jgi:hypothetical protein